MTRRITQPYFFHDCAASYEVIFPDVFFRFFHETHGESVGRERFGIEFFLEKEAIFT